MKKVFSSHSEVAHVWAQQIQEEGIANNVSFRNESIYSYGWWIMAKFVRPNLVLVRDWSYSNSTAKHLGHVKSAIPSGVNTIYVSNPEDITESIDSLVQTIEYSYNSFEKKRNKINVMTENSIAVRTLTELCNNLDITFPDISHYIIANEPAYVRMVEAQEIAMAEKQAYNERAEEEYKASVRKFLENSPQVQKLRNDWLNGGNKTTIEYKGRQVRLFDYPALRLKDGEVQTFFGARVPEREARILYKMIKAGKDIKGYKIGYYTVISINGTLKIGCHDIPMEEVQRFAKEGLNIV